MNKNSTILLRNLLIKLFKNIKISTGKYILNEYISST